MGSKCQEPVATRPRSERLTERKKGFAMNSGVVAEPRPNGPKAIRVLIADPDESLLAEYREHSQEGFDVVTALNGLECVDRLREQVPDVLVLEPQLLWGGGDGVLAVMHNDLDLATVPVMILTSCTDRGVLDDIARFPISDFHPKPLSPANLASRVHTLLDHHAKRSNFAVQNRFLERLIQKKMGGLIHTLRVETTEGGIIVHGRTGSYYARQLALAVLMEAIKSGDLEPQTLELDVQVCGSV